jgi:hypothetical protein
MYFKDIMLAIPLSVRACHSVTLDSRAHCTEAVFIIQEMWRTGPFSFTEILVLRACHIDKSIGLRRSLFISVDAPCISQQT